MGRRFVVETRQVPLACEGAKTNHRLRLFIGGWSDCPRATPRHTIYAGCTRLSFRSTFLFTAALFSPPFSTPLPIRSTSTPPPRLWFALSIRGFFLSQLKRFALSVFVKDAFHRGFACSLVFPNRSSRSTQLVNFSKLFLQALFRSKFGSPTSLAPQR